MTQNPNLAITEAVAKRLSPLLPDLVFVGGCATGLLITDPASAPVRPTRDVDVIAELASYAKYASLSQRLRDPGFQEQHGPGDPMCRWAVDGILLDVMPSLEAVLGFANRWYPGAIRHAREFPLSHGLTIRLVSSPFFLATKFEAFDSRGNKDYYASHDLEDIVTLLDGRKEVVEEIAASPVEVRAYLIRRFKQLLANEDFENCLPGHFHADAVSQSRVAVVTGRLRNMAEGATGRQPRNGKVGRAPRIR